MLLDLGPWRPDVPATDTGVTEATNCVPAVGCYEPQSTLTTYSAPLQNRAQGALSVTAKDGNVFWFAGDATDLYVMHNATLSWSIVSRHSFPTLSTSGVGCGVGFGTVTIVIPGGHEVPCVCGNASLSGTVNAIGLGCDVEFGGTPIVIPTGVGCGVGFGAPTIEMLTPPYSIHVNDAWSFAQYGERVFATNYEDPIQSYSLNSNILFDDLAGNPPRARYIAAVKNFLVAINTVDEDGAVPQRVRWSGLDNPDTWTVDSVTQADFQDLLGDGGANQGIKAGLTQADGAIIQERAVWRMTYEGLPMIFSFDLVEGVRGTPAPNSLVSLGGVVYYLGEDGFYAFDGAQSVPIGQGRINNYFFTSADPSRFHRMYGMADSSRKLIFWSYESTAASGNPDRILVYNWGTGEWSQLNIETEILWNTSSFGQTLEDLDIYGDIDSILTSFDSRVWTGGVAQLSAFDSTHSTVHFAGPALAATITTKELTLPDTRRVFVTQTWPIVQNYTATTTTKISVGRRSNPYATVSYTPAVTLGSLGYCPQRVTDNYLRFRLSISSSTVWQKASAVDVVFATPTSRR